MAKYNIYYKNKSAKCPHGFGYYIAGISCSRCIFCVGIDSAVSIKCSYEKEKELEEVRNNNLQNEIIIENKNFEKEIEKNLPAIDKYDFIFVDEDEKIRGSWDIPQKYLNPNNRGCE